MLERQLKMWRVHGFCNFLAQLRKKLCHDAVSGEPFAVSRVEKLFSNDAVDVEEKITRTRKSFLHPGGFLIEYAIGLDGFRIRIREQWVFNSVAIGKIFQDRFRVVADGGELHALLFEFRDCVLQLHQLPFAEGSPVGGTEKEENGSVRTFQGV